MRGKSFHAELRRLQSYADEGSAPAGQLLEALSGESALPRLIAIADDWRRERVTRSTDQRSRDRYERTLGCSTVVIERCRGGLGAIDLTQFAR